MRQSLHRETALDLWVMLYRGDDVPGWIAHCLDLDVITWGTTLGHAMEMACEAVVMVVGDDLDAGQDPLRRRAPQAFLDDLAVVLGTGDPVHLLPDHLAADSDRIGVLAVQLQVRSRPALASRARARTASCSDFETEWSQPCYITRPTTC